MKRRPFRSRLTCGFLIAPPTLTLVSSFISSSQILKRKLLFLSCSLPTTLATCQLSPYTIRMLLRTGRDLSLSTASSVIESWFFIEFPHWLDKYHSLCYVGGQPGTGIPRCFGLWVNVLSCKWSATVPFKFGMRMVCDDTVSWVCCESLTCTLLTASGLQNMVGNASEMI